jgi:hypothetical protein
MTDQEKNREPQESTEARRDQVQGDQKKGEQPFSGHPPIIITDSAMGVDTFNPDAASASTTTDDVLVGFDGVVEPDEHYRAGITGLVFTGTSLKKVCHVKVRHDDQGWHTCLDSPTNCRIFVSERHRQAGDVKHIEIDATSNSVIDIHFPADHRNETTANRKKMRGPLKKIRSLIILDRTGRLLHDCPVVHENKGCLICICDDCGIPCGD